MSDDRVQLDLRAEIARIDRDRVKSEKLKAEMTKRTEEAIKFRREPWLAIVVALAAFIGALIGSLPNWLRFL